MRKVLTIAAVVMALGLPGCAAFKPISATVDLAVTGVSAAIGGVQRTTDVAQQVVHTSHAVVDFVIPGKHAKDVKIKAGLARPCNENGSRDAARVASLQSGFRTIRSMVELYANQHNDKRPQLHLSWDQFLLRTNLDGVVGQGDGFSYGPYLTRPPVNPFNDSSDVCLLNDIDPQAGWAWSPDTGRIYAVVSQEIATRLNLDDADVVTYDAEQPIQ